MRGKDEVEPKEAEPRKAVRLFPIPEVIEEAEQGPPPSPLPRDMGFKSQPNHPDKGKLVAYSHPILGIVRGEFVTLLEDGRAELSVTTLDRKSVVRAPKDTAGKESPARGTWRIVDF